MSKKSFIYTSILIVFILFLTIPLSANPGGGGGSGTDKAKLESSCYDPNGNWCSIKRECFTGGSGCTVKDCLVGCS